MPSQDGVSAGGGKSDITTMRLFPDMQFGCRGTLLRLTVAVNDRMLTGGNGSRIQVWREVRAQPGVYKKTSVDILIVKSSPFCNLNSSGGLIQCTFSAAMPMEVEPRDILGLELPALNDTDLEVLFVSGGNFTSHIFQSQLGANATLSEADDISDEQPQLNVLVAPDTGIIVVYMVPYKILGCTGIWL